MRKSLVLLTLCAGVVGCGGSTAEVEITHYEVVCGAGLCLNVVENGQEKGVPQVEGYVHQWASKTRCWSTRIASDERGPMYRLSMWWRAGRG